MEGSGISRNDGVAKLNMVSVRLSVRSGVDLDFKTSTNGQDLDGRTGPGPEIEVRRSAQG
jgi:hypothetical protein